MNGIAAMSHAPVVVETFMAISNAIDKHASFPPRVRETISLAVSAAVNCTYCVAAHTIACQNADISLDETVQIRRGEVTFDTKLAPLLVLAREIVTSAGDIQDQTWQLALEAGWTDTELAETFAHVAKDIFTTYFTHYSQAPQDVPDAPALGDLSVFGVNS